jgi:hypothetical protein
MARMTHMRRRIPSQTIVLSLAIIATLGVAGCGGRGVNTATNAALEPTALLYPFEPIPIASYEGMGLATHKDLRIAQEMARSQAMADLGSNIFDTVSSQVDEVISSREDASVFTAVRSLSTSLPLAGKKFVEYRVGENTGTVYCRIYMAKSEVDEHVMAQLAQLSQELIDGPIKDRLARQLSGEASVNADVRSLTLFHEQQLTRARADNVARSN